MKKSKRKMLLIFPVVVIPFLTMVFWALGGGKNNVTKTNESQGLNLRLPDLKLKEEKTLDKLGFYDKADKDSAKMAEWMRNDPYYKKEVAVNAAAVPDELDQMTHVTAEKYHQQLKLTPWETVKLRPEQEILKKLALLQNELDKAKLSPADDKPARISQGNELSGEINRLEKMMNLMNTDSEEDPEVKQISNVMDKILDIQHPNRVVEKMAVPLKGKVQVKDRPADDTAVTGFHTWDNEPEDEGGSAIEAVVNENQVLVNGAVIKLRLLHDIYILGSKVPAGNFVFGIVALSGERLQVAINSIRNKNSLFNVKMELYDMDGLPGIFIPGAISRDVAKQSSDNSLQLMEFQPDPSLKAQATSAGLSTARNLLSRKAKLISVKVKSGYKVLLKNSQP